MYEKEKKTHFCEIKILRLIVMESWLPKKRRKLWNARKGPKIYKKEEFMPFMTTSISWYFILLLNISSKFYLITNRLYF